MCLVCIQELTRNAYDNLNYRSEKHLKRLQNDSTVDLIYPSRWSLVNLVSYHYGSCTARISLCVKLLPSRKWRYISRHRAPSWQHNCGLSENQETTDWPPAANEMQLRSEEFLLQYFSRFLNLVTARKEDVGSSLVFSTEQNLCRAVSEAAWKLPI